MDFKLSKELEMLQKAVREFANQKIAPNVDQWDEKHHFPYKEAINPMGELGFWGPVIQEEYEGEDMGWSSHDRHRGNRTGLRLSTCAGEYAGAGLSQTYTLIW